MANQLRGHMDEFRPESGDNWQSYSERMAMYLTNNKITDRREQVYTVLTTIGAATYDLLVDLASPTPPNELSYQEIHGLLLRHYQPRKLQTAERYRFHQCTQQPGQTINQYLATLRKAASRCNFGANLNSSLLDQFVSGLKAETVRRRLLSETDLDLARATEIALSMEAADTNLKTFTSKSAAIPVDKVAPQPQPGYKKPKRRHQPGQQRPQRQFPNSQSQPPRQSTPQRQQGHRFQCGRCNSNSHRPDECKFRNSECFKCRRIGHVQKACRSAASNRFSQRTHTVEATPLEQDFDALTIQRITTVCSTAASSGQPAPMVPIQLNGKSVSLELDTGSVKTLINENTWRRQLGKPELAKPSVQLISYTGHQVAVKGQCTLKVQYGTQCAELEAYVVKGHGSNLLGREWLQTLKLDWHKIFAVKAVQNAALSSLLSKYSELFKPGLGKCKGLTAKIQLKPGATPKFCKARPIAYSLKEKVEEDLARLQALGVIEPVTHSDWACATVNILKPTGAVRICGDFRETVNPQMLIDQYPLPKPQELFSSLNGGEKFSKLDMADAYLQIPVDPACKHLLTINTHKGLFQYARLPFGVSSAVAVFQKIMETVLQGLPGIAIYLDDITVTGANDAEHLRNLDNVFRRLQEYGLRLRKEKCDFLQSSVEYLGFVVDKNGVRPSPKKVKAVTDMPAPSNVSEVRSFMGMVKHYGPFIPNLSNLAGPINQLTQQGVPWDWGPAQQKAFLGIKTALTSMDCLVHYDPNLPLTLACDASSGGLGAVLCHRFPNGTERPIAFASKTLSKAEQNYSQVEKEGLGIVFGIKKFHQFIFGRHFELITDNKPLLAIYSPSKGIPAMCLSRLQRWALLLNAYSYSIRFRPTAQHGSADGLSRLAIGDDPDFEREQSEEVAVNSLQVLQIQQLPVDAKQVRQATAADPVLSKVLQFVAHGWPEEPDDPQLLPFFRKQSELSLESGIIVWGYRVVIPPALRPAMLQELHNSHSGIVKMKATGRSHMWWPGFDDDVEAVAKQCVACNLKANEPRQAPLQPWPFPQHPWSRVHIDFCGPTMGSHYLVAVCAHSKWAEVAEMPQGYSAARTTSALRSMFTQHGLCRQIVSDNGPPFQSFEFAEFCQANGIEHKRIAPHHPQTNGEAERFVGTFKAAMRPFEQLRGTAKEKAIANFLLSYRSTIHSTTAATPSQLLNKRELRTRLSLIHPYAAQAAEANQQRLVEKRNERAKLRQFNVGDAVWARDFRGNKWAKGRISAVLGSHNYTVSVGTATEALSWKRHVDQLRARNEPPPIPPVPTPKPPANVEPALESEADSDAEDAAAQTMATTRNKQTIEPQPAARRYPARNRNSNLNKLWLFNTILCATLACCVGFTVASAAAPKTTTTTTAATTTTTVVELVTGITGDPVKLRETALRLAERYEWLEQIRTELESTKSAARRTALQLAYQYLSGMDIDKDENQPPAASSAPAVSDAATTTALEDAAVTTTLGDVVTTTATPAWYSFLQSCTQTHYWLMAISLLMVAILVLLISKLCRSHCCNWQLQIQRRPPSQQAATEVALLPIPRRRPV